MILCRDVMHGGSTTAPLTILEDSVTASILSTYWEISLSLLEIATWSCCTIQVQDALPLPGYQLKYLGRYIAYGRHCFMYLARSTSEHTLSPHEEPETRTAPGGKGTKAGHGNQTPQCVANSLGMINVKSLADSFCYSPSAGTWVTISVLQSRDILCSLDSISLGWSKTFVVLNMLQSPHFQFRISRSAPIPVDSPKYMLNEIDSHEWPANSTNATKEIIQIKKSIGVQTGSPHTTPDGRVLPLAANSG